MADNEFDLGEAMGSYEQARADRNFYLSMVQGGTQMASPIAAYLAGVAGVKMAGERAKVQNIEDNIQAQKDATAATERLQKRQDSLRTQLVSIVKGVQDGTLPASVGATMVGHLGKELGINVKQYDAENGKLVYTEGSDQTAYEWDWRESPTAKQQLAIDRLDIAKSREERLAKADERKAELDKIRIQKEQKKLDDLVAGKASSGNTAAETRFLSENKGLFEVVNNPKGMMKNRPIEDRISGYALTNKAGVQNWLRGVKTLSPEAQERLAAITQEVAKQAMFNRLISNEEYQQYVKQEAAQTGASALESFFQ